MSYTISLALAVPAALRDKANRLSCALGHDVLPGSTYSVPLSADGQEPATHYGCHAWVQPSFVAILAGATQGHLPEVDWADYGITAEDVAAVVAGLIASEPQGELLDFDSWSASYGLARVMPAEPAEG